MPLPLTPGSEVGGPSITKIAELLRRLLPDGFDQEDSDAEHMIELETYAVALLDMGQATRRLRGNMSPRTTVELLAEWEAAFGLTDDASREISDRQARLVAAESARGGASPSRIATAIEGISDTANPQTPTAEEVSDDDLAGQMIFQLLTAISEAEYADTATRRALASILARIIPARCFGQDGASDIAKTFSTKSAEWAGAEAFIGRTHIRRTGDPGVDASAPSQRIREYGPGSVLRAADINAIQDAILRRPCAGGTMPFASMRHGQRSFAFAIACNTGASTILSSSLDFRKRLIFASLRWSAQNIRPGQAFDNTFGVATAVSRLLYMGTGDTNPTSTPYRTELAANLAMYANAVDGVLYIRNDTGTTRYLVGMLTASEQYDNADAGLADVDDGATMFAQDLDAAWLDAMSERGLMRYFEGTTAADDWSGGEGYGSRSIVAYAVNMAPGTSITLDRSCDWRDRVVFATCIAIGANYWTGFSNAPAGPMGADPHSSETEFTAADKLTAPHGAADPEASAAALGYTRLGQADGTLTPNAVNLSASLRLWVPASGGAELRLTRDADGGVRETYLIMVEGSFQTGERSSPTAWPVIAAADGDDVVPGILNGLQDRSLLGVAGDTTGVQCQSHALGTRRGSNVAPWIPEPYRHHDLVLQQQRGAVGQVRRMFASDVATLAEVVLDTTIDWRDRMVRAHVQRSATYDILPGEADDEHAGDAGAPVFSCLVARYTGTGGHSSLGSGLDVGYHLVLLEDDSGGDGYVREATELLASNISIGGTDIYPVSDTLFTAAPAPPYFVELIDGATTEIVEVTSVVGGHLLLSVGTVNAYVAGPGTVGRLHTAEDTGGICIYARTSDGALVLRNRSALTQHVIGFVDASFPLGFRS